VELTHGMANVEPDLRLHCVTAGDGPRTIVLLHGFPQTWWEWRRVIPALVDAGLKVIAPDYRGAGHSGRPPGGYYKVTMRATSSTCYATTSSSRARSSGLGTTSG
jgi:pimeloyl-ACP methyl ester carboxylesterase